MRKNKSIYFDREEEVLKFYHDRSRVRITKTYSPSSGSTIICVYGWNKPFLGMISGEPSYTSILFQLEDYDKIMRFLRAKRSRKVARRWFMREARSLVLNNSGVFLCDILDSSGNIDWKNPIIKEANIKEGLWKPKEEQI